MIHRVSPETGECRLEDEQAVFTERMKRAIAQGSLIEARMYRDLLSNNLIGTLSTSESSDYTLTRSHEPVRASRRRPSGP